MSLLSSDQSAQFSGVSTQGAQGVRFAASANQLQPVKTGFIANVFPSDGTWHPLYNHDYNEMANVLLEPSDDPAAFGQIDAKLVNGVKAIVIDSYEVSVMSWVWKFLILGVLALIVVIFTTKSVTASLITVGVTTFICGGLWFYAANFARGNGEAYWSEFYYDISTKTGAMTRAAIIDGYSQLRQQERLLAAQDRQSAAIRASGHGGSSITGTAFSSVVGNLFSPSK